MDDLKCLGPCLKGRWTGKTARKAAQLEKCLLRVAGNIPQNSGFRNFYR
jgi:hypothetical protein